MGRPPTRHAIIRHTILLSVGEHPNDLVQHVAGIYEVTGAAIYRHVRRLLRQGALVATGSRKFPNYRLGILLDKRWTVQLAGLLEDVVWRDLVRPNIPSDATPEALAICEYGFTEMLNNAIDHSGSVEATVALEISSVRIRLTVRDFGVGIFRKITQALRLEDEHYAILELAKGKFTTDRAHHSGEGIFFTSRAMDTFAISSEKLYFYHSIRGTDFLTDDEEDGSTQGTTVEMNIDPRTERRLATVFDEYADVEGGFSRTVVPVKLGKYGDENLVSRSQAKRVLARLDQFKEVLFDFSGVQSIGQGFADEVFRVFPNNHPGTQFRHVQANADVGRMIAHVEAEGRRASAADGTERAD